MTVQGETVDTGKYLWVYKKEADGQWRFGRVIYNSGT
jgi:ketosteroid isomerase-like protein